MGPFLLIPGHCCLALVTSFTGAWVRAHASKAMYDAKGIPIGEVLFAWQRQTIPPSTVASPINPADGNWAWGIILADDDKQTNPEITSNMSAAGPSVGTYFPPTGVGHTFASVSLSYAAAAGADGSIYGISWTYLGIIGRSGVIVRGPLGAAGGGGVLASDVVVDALKRWAPKIGYTVGPLGTIQPTSYWVPQAAYTDPTTVSAVIKDILKYELIDWAVWEGPMFYMNSWGSRGREWNSRVREAQLQDAGPQVDRTFNAVVVTFTDAAGISRSVGPPGGNTQYTDPALYDPDPQNLATMAGILRWSPPLSVNTASLQSAINAGARYLQELKQSSTSGQAQLVGYVEDLATGVEFPAWMVRAGDWIQFSDASNPSLRRIVRSSYDDTSKTNTISLDAPPDDMQALLERMDAAILNLSG